MTYSYIFALACVSGEEFLRPARASQQLGREHGNRRVVGSDVAVIQPPRRLQMLFRIAAPPLKLCKNIAERSSGQFSATAMASRSRASFAPWFSFMGPLYCRRGAAFRTGRVRAEHVRICAKKT